MALALVAVTAVLVVAGCGRRVYSDLRLTDGEFSIDERDKAVFRGSIENTGSTTYNSVFLVIDAYEGEEYVTRLEMGANLGIGQKLGPGQTTSVSKNFEDGGTRPNRFEIVRFYGVQ